MFYVSVPPPDHGLLEFPTNAYGGFAYRANTLERPTTNGQQIPTDPTKRFVTEHNLGLFWRRPGLYPRALALPIPLLSTADAYKKGTVNRPPGMLRADCAPIRYRQRNLLTGELEDDSSIRIWTINDSSDHKQLLHYKLSIANAGSAQRRENLLFLNKAMIEDGPIGRIELASEVLQLKAFIDQNQTTEGGTGKVFLRTRNGLQLADIMENIVWSIFQSQTFAFTQLPHMDGELAVVDSRGMLFWGHIDKPDSFARFKCPTIHKDICPTDCPRILVSIDENEARLLDLRDSNCAGQLLFTHSFADQLGDGIDGPFSEEFHASLVARDQLCRVHTVDIGLETVLVTSNRRHTLIDPRMPGLPLLTMAHGEIDGADYSIVTPPFVDPETGGRVFSLFSLTHTKNPELSHWSLMYHPNECLWSSVGSKYALDTPRDAVTQFMQLHTDGSGIATTQLPAARRRTVVDTSVVPKYTRAIHYQQLDKNLSIASTRALLFRQMEGGEIWYENVFFDPLPKLRQDDGPRRGAPDYEDVDECEGNFGMEPIDEAKMKERSLEKIAKYQAKRLLLHKPIGTHFFEGIQEELMEFRQSKQRQAIGKKPGELASAVPIVDLTSLEIASEIVCLAEDQNEQQNGVALSPAPSTTSSLSFSTGYNPFAAVHHISNHNALMDEHIFGTFDEQFEGHEDKLFSVSVSRIWHKTLARWQEAKEERAQNELGLTKDDAEIEEEEGKDGDQEDDNDNEEEDMGEEEEENEYDRIII